MKKFKLLLLDANVVLEYRGKGYLLDQPDECRICSADKTVYRVLGCLSRPDQGVSLDEVLRQIGLGRKLEREFTKAYREEWTKKGFQEGLTGLGLARRGRTRNNERRVTLSRQRAHRPPLDTTRVR